MTDREILNELMGYCSTIEGCGEDLLKAKVGYLIANGVTVKKFGRWGERPFLLGTSNFCSLCDSFYGMPHGKYNYCPNCGAKMDLDGDDHD